MALRRNRRVELADQAQKMNLDHIKSLDDMSRGLMERQTYFLITAAGAGIGFALTKFEVDGNSAIRWFMLLALLSWGICFLSGLLHADIQIKQMKYNADKLRVDSRTGHYRGISRDEQIRLKAVRMHAIEKFSKHGAILWKTQYLSMFTGALLFLLAHVVIPMLGC